MKRTIPYVLAFLILIFLFRFITTQVDTEDYSRFVVLKEWESTASEKSSGELLAASLEAYGGMERIGSIEGIYLKNTIVIYDQNQRALKGESTEFYRFPDQVRVNFRFDADELTHFYNGLEAWTVMGSNTSKAPDFIAEDLRRSIKHFPTTLLLSSFDERSLLSPLVPIIENDRMVYSLGITDRENDYSEIWFDAETLLLSRIEYVLYSSLGADTMTIDISDYREVDGIQTAFAATIFYNGKRAQETVIEEVRYNPNLPDSLFVPKSGEE